MTRQKSCLISIGNAGPSIHGATTVGTICMSTTEQAFISAEAGDPPAIEAHWKPHGCNNVIQLFPFSLLSRDVTHQLGLIASAGRRTGMF